MKNYYRVMLGRNSIHTQICVAENFIGADYEIRQDLTGKLPEEWRDFNQEFIPVYLAIRPDKTRIAAGLACGALWMVAKGIRQGDIVLCPDGAKHYHVGEVVGEYAYQPEGILPHRRPVRWFDQTIDRADMSEELKGSTGAPGTVNDITGYHAEIERLIAGIAPPQLIATDETIENPTSFVMEKHLEDFLVQNWAQTELGKDYDIYEDEGVRFGQQYRTDTGPMDIFAVSKDKQTLLVIELKKGRASDAVVGQILRYMGYVKEELAEQNQKVKGVIIALEDDRRIRRALAMAPDVTFYRYRVRFELVKA